MSIEETHPEAVKKFDAAIKDYLVATGTDPVMASGCVARDRIIAQSVARQLEPGFMLGLISPEAAPVLEKLVEGRGLDLQQVADVGAPPKGQKPYTFFNIPESTPVTAEKISVIADKLNVLTDSIKNPISREERVALVVQALEGISASEAFDILHQGVKETGTLSPFQQSVFTRQIEKLQAAQEEISAYR